MRIVLDVHGGVPAYRQIVDQVRFLVAAGQLVAGEALPSTRALAQSLGINPMTVPKASALREAEGVGDPRPGLTLAVRAQPPDLQAAAREAALRASLAPAVRAARQLGYSADDAARLLAQLLDHPSPPDATS